MVDKNQTNSVWGIKKSAAVCKKFHAKPIYRMIDSRGLSLALCAPWGWRWMTIYLLLCYCYKIWYLLKEYEKWKCWKCTNNYRNHNQTNIPWDDWRPGLETRPFDVISLEISLISLPFCFILRTSVLILTVMMRTVDWWHRASKVF